MGIHSLMHNLKTKDAVPAVPAVSGDKPTKQEIYRNRFQFGPNIGSCFVLEKWIDNSLYCDNCENDSELGALQGCKKSGASIDDIRKKWEDHWSNFVSNDDFSYLRSKGVTAVRLPIPFWFADGGSFTKGTEFEEFKDVFKNSWKFVEQVIETAKQNEIGVLIDMHALPGGANGDSHSGTASGEAGFWRSSSCRDTGLKVLTWTAEKIKDIENIVGLQLVNEAPFGEDKCKSFYLDAISQIRKVAPGLPLVISDGWNLDEWRKVVRKLDEEASSKSTPASCGIIIDTHVYRTFSDEDMSKNAETHVEEACSAIPPDDDTDVMVGEFSCCLSEETWKATNGDRGQLEAQFGSNLLKCFEKSSRAGAYFWTYKFGQGDGGSWDFRVMADKGALNVGQPKAQPLDETLSRALNDHKNYWDGQNDKEDWEHWRFEDGFKQGYADAAAFAEFNNSRLGRLSAWKTARLAEHIKQKGNSDKTWVYSQAFVQGVDAFWG